MQAGSIGAASRGCAITVGRLGRHALSHRDHHGTDGTPRLRTAEITAEVIRQGKPFMSPPLEPAWPPGTGLMGRLEPETRTSGHTGMTVWTPRPGRRAAPEVRRLGGGRRAGRQAVNGGYPAKTGRIPRVRNPSPHPPGHPEGATTRASRRSRPNPTSRGRHPGPARAGDATPYRLW